MAGRGFEADFSAAAVAEANKATPPVGPLGTEVRDLRNLLWCSIDNIDSRDLAQLTVAERNPGGVRVLVAVGDVSAVLPPDWPLDKHAAVNTTSI